jgi:hypothetical protein
MALTAKGKNAALTGGFTNAATHVGALQAGTALTAVTATATTFTKTAHGMANGTPVLISGLTGGNSLVAGRVYFVRDTATNTFSLAVVPGGGSGEQAAVNVGTNVTAATVTPYVEIAYHTSGARQTQSWNTPVGGVVDNNVVGGDLNIPSAGTVNALGCYSASTAGDLLDLAVVTAEGPYGANGAYQVSDYDVDLNATA